MAALISKNFNKTGQQIVLYTVTGVPDKGCTILLKTASVGRSLEGRRYNSNLFGLVDISNSQSKVNQVG